MADALFDGINKFITLPSIGDFDELLNSADRGTAKQLAIELSNACEFARTDSGHHLASK